MKIRTVPPLEPVREAFPTGGGHSAVFEFSQLPPLPRFWLMSEDECELLQLQVDRLLLNWRKRQDHDQYPRFANVYGRYKKLLASFGDFCLQADFGRLVPNQYELTYVNIIDLGITSTDFVQIGNILPDLCWRLSDRYLTEPEGFTFQTSFLLPNNAGRLHVDANTAININTGAPSILKLEFTARGFGESAEEKSMDDWFAIAHEAVVRTFADFTSDEYQHAIWSRTQ